MDNQLQKQIWSEIAKRSKDYVMQANDPKLWAKAFLSAEVFSNQNDIMKAVADLNTRYMVVIGSRGSGKTWGVCAGLIKMAVDNPNLEIGIFGPRTDQAGRIISEARTLLTGTKLHEQVDWVRTTAHRLMFKNGSYMLALSAAETSQQEGWHFDVIAVDEAHRVTDIAMTQRILPMLGSKKIYKLIKIGIPLYKNHFYRSYGDPKYKILQHNWTESPLLLRSGFKEIEGKKYPSTVLDRVPMSIKQKMFPNNPELHYDGDMTELEFQTQYNMTWVDDLNTFLSSEEQEKILGTHKIMESPQTGETYFFGLDTASGSIIPGKSDLDFTSLSIWRKSGTGIKEKICCFEWQGGETLGQLKDVLEIVNPIGGLFPCAFGCVDYSNVGITAVEIFKNNKIAVAGIMFAQTEPSSHKNYKNAMAHHFKFELQADRVKMPSFESMEKHRIMRKHFYEWCSLERHSGVGLNDLIRAPSGSHDDGVFSDMLAVWAADKSETLGMNRPLYKIPMSGINRGLYSARPGMSDYGKRIFGMDTP
jgi:hypothetical protein